MLLCEPCVDKEHGEGHHDVHAVRAFGIISRGQCESCREVGLCVDCKCYGNSADLKREGQKQVTTES